MFEAESPRHWIMGKAAFEGRMPHHDGIEALWEEKWQPMCAKSAYPFHDGAYEDFEPIFQHLIENNINDATSPDYTSAFISAARKIAEQGDRALEKNNQHDQALSLYLRACAVYRIARFPYITSFPQVNDKRKWTAWEEQKRVYRKAGELWENPLEEASVPHTHAEGRDLDVIPVYVRMPNPLAARGVARRNGAPVVVLMTGLDGYRPDNTARCEECLRRGWATVVVEIPGTADCPADSADPESPDRLWSSLFEWMEDDGRFDMRRIIVWGLSCGGYYAVRIAHTHPHRLAGCVAQGAGCHYFFGKDWLEKVDGHEYPFQLTPAMAMKYGFDSVEEYKENAQHKFSLLYSGILDKPATRLLLVNGTRDGLMPIEDSLMLFEHGTPKEGRFFGGNLHMGYPQANSCVYPWMEEIMASVRE
ncbi:uncharacterized protein THITE_2142739 [Thermothielavioides terrestris NRRL 8126]|uniref:Uncharacterized protein n=2 Tax=Thermothielavioides terrestris TaxID=2587410 RepID=G2R2A1_THETT|nr:uncharacterized protein THITE_2142739 [Thermothielavioides terrestris NRRL 8126]AEO64969.1 hypothetical protein THITE_2142739 [Thermothielavioides terrestris NRRL 8126]